MGNFQDLRTVDYHQARRKDPIVTLWRTVLSVAIEDAIKMKARMIEHKEYWENKVCTKCFMLQNQSRFCHSLSLRRF